MKLIANKPDFFFFKKKPICQSLQRLLRRGYFLMKYKIFHKIIVKEKEQMW